MMNRWAKMKEEMAVTRDGKRGTDRRPFLASECQDLGEAEKWRRELVRDITRKIAEIQNAGLGEGRIRDLNDEINKLIRTKHHWERQIKALGGPDYTVIAARSYDDDVDVIDGRGGYKYFGAARELPGVKELFAAAAAEPSSRSRGDMYKSITPDYYGYRDEADGILLAAEARREAEWIGEAVAEYHASAPRRKRARGGDGGVAHSSASHATQAEDDDDDDDVPLTGFKSHVPLPSQQDIDALLVERRKQLLMAKYAAVPAATISEAAVVPSSAAVIVRDDDA